MQGIDNLTVHLPDIRAGRGWIFGLTVFASFVIATTAMVVVDRLWPAGTGLGQVAAIFLGFVVAGQFFWRRAEYRARWGDLAYQKALKRHVLIGLPVIFAAIAHTAYLPGRPMLIGWLRPAASIIGLYLILTGLVLWGRAVFSCGFDTLAMLYVYFPQEGRMVEAAIYGVIRHPVYSAVIRVGLALGLWRGTWFSIAFGLFMPLGLTLWLRLVEERELIERFGSGYTAYRQQVPAFWPRVRDAGRFLQFIISGRWRR